MSFISDLIQLDKERKRLLAQQKAIENINRARDIVQGATGARPEVPTSLADILNRPQAPP